MSAAHPLPSQRTLAAFHEAGHVVARAYRGLPVAPVEIAGDGDGLTHGSGEMIRFDAFGEVVVAIAGQMSECRLIGKPYVWDEEDVESWDERDDAGTDFDKIARMVTQHGVIVAHAMSSVDLMLDEHWEAVREIAERLADAGRLNAPEVNAILARHDLLS